MNEKLMKEFNKEEIEVAIKSMALLKAFGENRFPALFYKKFWHIVREEVTKFCLDILNRRKAI